MLTNSTLLIICFPFICSEKNLWTNKVLSFAQCQVNLCLQKISTVTQFLLKFPYVGYILSATKTTTKKKINNKTSQKVLIYVHLLFSKQNWRSKTNKLPALRKRSYTHILSLKETHICTDTKKHGHSSRRTQQQDMLINYLFFFLLLFTNFFGDLNV